MVGLPARGKTYTAHKLARYLRWIGIKTAVFNVGAYRREITGGHYSGHELFRADNDSGKEVRLRSAMLALDNLSTWFGEEQDGAIGILDATNSTRERRAAIAEYCK